VPAICRRFRQQLVGLIDHLPIGVSRSERGGESLLVQALPAAPRTLGRRLIGQALATPPTRTRIRAVSDAIRRAFLRIIAILLGRSPA
jgi:hypothetical protein